MKKTNQTQSKNDRLDFMNQYVSDSTKEVTKQSEVLISSQHIDDNISKEAKKIAIQIANNDHKALKQFSGVKLNSKDCQSYEYIKFQLVNDFLESIGCKFTPGVFRNESQNPTTLVERLQVADFLHLRSYDQTPLLVQLIEALRIIKKS